MSTVKSDGSAFDVRGYRDALGCFGTGVCLITTRDEAGRARAITANSFSSVSLHPPIILWCIDVHSDRYDLFAGADHFGVSFLREHHGDVSTEFARNVDAELSGAELKVDQHGFPLYADALGYLECETGFRQKAGDHVVIFGNVIGFDAQAGNGLGFFKGDYTPLIEKKD